MAHSGGLAGYCARNGAASTREREWVKRTGGEGAQWGRAARLRAVASSPERACPARLREAGFAGSGERIFRLAMLLRNRFSRGAVLTITRRAEWLSRLWAEGRRRPLSLRAFSASFGTSTRRTDWLAGRSPVAELAGTGGVRVGNMACPDSVSGLVDATPPQRFALGLGKRWWRVRVTIPRPADYDSDALPTELTRQMKNAVFWGTAFSFLW